MCAFHKPTRWAHGFLMGLTLAALPGLEACVQTRELFGTQADAGLPTDASVADVYPVTPLPSPEQLAWQAQELTAFFHFGINTFTNKEQSFGTDNPTLFNPTGLAISQWMNTLQGAGFRHAMLTAKHVDGFCLWPTKCTTYSVAAATAWKGGGGDVVGLFVQAARQANIGVGLAIDPSAGTAPNETLLLCELKELLTNYGPIDEIWVWGGSSVPVPANFDWAGVADLVHKLQPHVLLDDGDLIESVGADVRSTGQALVSDTQIDQSSIQPDPTGAAKPPIWYPAEAVYRTRTGWFWHAAENASFLPLNQLIDIYYNSVGRNSLLRLNLSPDNQGLLFDGDVAMMNQFGAAITDIYQTNVAAGQPATADSVFMNLPTYAAAMAVDGKLDTYWAAADNTTPVRLEIDLGGPRMFNVVNIQEPIAIGERITKHSVEAMMNGAWTTIAADGTFVGHRKLHRVGPITASAIALVITAARGTPAVAEFGAYLSPNP
jgi:alpha-L-fucosidase